MRMDQTPRKVEECGNCGKPYTIAKMGFSTPGGKETEIADCPSCGKEVYRERTSGFVMAHALSPEAEAKYQTEKNSK